jgi:anthranilate phosphoribosyltransferase
VDQRASWPALIGALIRGETLTAEECSWAMGEVMDGAATPVQIAGFAVALRAKGETVSEVSGLARAMLEHAAPISVPGPVADLVGTGGDGAHTVNISTMGMITAAAAGARIVKHGNRAASSACGSADVLEALGVVIDLPPAATEQLVAEVGAGFLFAALYHPGFRHASVPRRELGVPTVFNFLGPLTNPARPSALAVGVADRRMGPVLAGVLAGRGNSALVFHGDDGLDELTTTGPSAVWVVHEGTVSQVAFDPTDLGIGRSELAELVGGDAARAGARHGAAERRRRAGRGGGRGRSGGPRPGAGRRLRAGRRGHRLRSRGRSAGPVGGGQPAAGPHQPLARPAASSATREVGHPASSATR